MNELHLFAGVGGGILGSIILGHTPVCAVEIDEYNRKILLARQRDGILPRFPIWDDVQTFDGKPWRGSIDVVCGGFPCQDISWAGKRAGITGERSGLWKEYFRILQEVQPQFVFAENSSRLIGNGLDVLLEDLASLGYDAKWGCFTASSDGAPHARERCFVLAYPGKQRAKGDWWSSWAERRLCGIREAGGIGWEREGSRDVLWPSEPAVERILPNGVANGLDRHYAIGNGQVARVAALAWETLIA